jgi:tetratricopeptide (TPR) repeat protein
MAHVWRRLPWLFQMAQPKSAKTPDEPSKSTLALRLRAAAEMATRLAVWIWRHPLQAGIVTGIVLLPVLPIIVVQITLNRNLPAESVVVAIDEAFAALDRHDFAEVAEIARSFGAEGPMTADELQAKPYLLGVAADQEAGHMLDKAQRRLRLVAARYLGEARLMGFPAGREAEGLFLLGKNLYESGQSTASIKVLEEALAMGGSRRTELHQLLADAYLDLPEPNFHEALAHNRHYLAEKGLSNGARQQGLIDRSRIEFGLEDYTACQKTLDSLTADSANQLPATVMRALLLEHEARAVAGGGPLADNTVSVEKCRQAIELLEKVSPETETLAADAAYLLGRLRLEVGDSKAALVQLQRTQQRWPETESGFAAGVLAGQWLRQKGRNAEALAAYRIALEKVDGETQYKNRWLSRDDLRTGALDAYQEFLRQQQFELAMELARLCSPIFSAARSLQLQAQAHAQWGRHLLATADSAPSKETTELVSQGRRRLRQAGMLYRRLAAKRLASREYPDDLYDAAEADLAGHNYTSAVETFRKYLRAEARKRRPRALLALGESLLALGRPASALEALNECIEFHARDAAVFEARLLAARAYLEQGTIEPAEKLLLENLDGDALSPASTEWRDSLFALGRLLYEAGRYTETIRRLDEAIARYPNADDIEEARYLAAESYRRSAREVQRQESQEATAEGRLARHREWTQLLETGLVRFEQELNAMLVRQEQHPLTPLDDAILRNCFFARGAILFDLGRYQEAIQAYASITNRYQQKPEVLQAYAQIAACYRRLGQNAEARSTLEQAKYALKHLAEGLAFEDTSNYSRQEWGQLFETLGTL